MKAGTVLIDPDGTVTVAIASRRGFRGLLAAAWTLLWTGRVAVQFRQGQLMFHEDFNPRFAPARPVQVDRSGNVVVGEPTFRAGKGDC